jgi:hypothetical protein
MTILRDSVELTVCVEAFEMNEGLIRRVISFAGANIQEPHRAVYQQHREAMASKVYIGCRNRGLHKESDQIGSPAAIYGLCPTSFITHVNGIQNDA